MMNVKNLSMLAALLAIVSFNTGCPVVPPPSTDTLDNTEDLPDEDGDGFGELGGCDGAGNGDSIAVSIVNTITRAEAEAFAENSFGIALPDVLTAGVGVRVDFAITRTYVGGEQCTDRGSRELEPFDDIMVEAPCPESVSADVSVVLAAPIVGDIEVFTQTFDLSLGEGSGLSFTCNKVIRVTSFIDDTGQPNADIAVEDQ